LIKNQDNFLKALKVGYEFVKKNPDCILLFGEKPKEPDIGLGYIKKGRLFEKINNFSFFKVDLFKEKPDLKTAQKFIESKKFFWNSGIFVFQPKLIEKLIKEFVPDNFKIYQKLKKNFGKKNFKEILKKEYPKMDSVSFDQSILENYTKNILLPVNFGWADIGSWSAVKKILAGEKKNLIKGNFIGIDSKDILVYGVSPQLVATCGVKDLIVVVTDDIILICSKNRAQDVKKLVERIEKEGKKELL
jgi:mannose-1-phosphate guanylyltransferase